MEARHPGSKVLATLLEDKSPTSECVDTLVRYAVHAVATDLFFSPRRDDYQVSMRCDGIIVELGAVPNAWAKHVTNHVKVDAGLNAAERRRPQDGRIAVADGERQIDVRVSTLPMFFGEEVALRILDRQVRLTELDRLNLGDAATATMRQLIRATNGLILVSGPAGSGKSTTLYALLNELNDGTRRINTLEEPVEAYIPGILQTEVRVKLGLDFADLLPAVLRHDPDIIMIGEVRDVDTATIALRAAASGQLVLATVHAPRASGAIDSMLGLGANPFLLASSLRGVIAQDMLRKTCQGCAQEIDAPAGVDLADLQSYVEADWAPEFRRGSGCERCFNSGYHGLMAIAEVFKASKKVRALIEQGVPRSAIDEQLASEGVIPLSVSAKRAMASGHTTIEEASRIFDR